MGFATIDQAVAALSSFRTRPEAIHDLLRRGADARDAARKLLDARDPALVWCGIRLLGDIGEKADAERLADYVHDPEYAQVAQDAMKSLGVEPPSRVPTGGAPRAGARLGNEQLVRSAIAGAVGVSLRREGDGYRLTVPVGSASREISVTFPVDDEDGALVTVFSDIGVAADAAFYERVLKLNARLPDGAVGIQTLDGEARFVMTDTHLRETLDPPELAKSIFGLARFSARIAHRIQHDPAAEAAAAPTPPATGD